MYVWWREWVATALQESASADGKVYTTIVADGPVGRTTPVAYSDESETLRRGH